MLVRDIHGIPGSPGDVADNGAFILENCIDQRGLSDVRPSHDCEFERRFTRFLVAGDYPGTVALDFLNQFCNTAAVRGTDCYEIFETKRGKFRVGQFLLRVIDLIDCKDHGFSGGAQLLRQFPIHWGEAVP